MSADDELLHAAGQGDARAFGRLYARYREAILAYCLRLTRNPEVAADLMAETFAAALLAVSRDSASHVETPAAWLFGIARNKMIDSERRGRVDAEARKMLELEPLVLDDRDIARINELGADDAILSALPGDLSHAVRARVLDELDYAEIARTLDCSEQVVRKRVSRGLTKLRSRLQEGQP